jgi:hypothetical protein
VNGNESWTTKYKEKRILSVILGISETNNDIE